jgi:hypothetical protein
MLAAPILIDRLMTNYWAGVSGEGIGINPRWRPNKKRNGIHHPGPDQCLSFASFPAPLVSYWSLPLRRLRVQ